MVKDTKKEWLKHYRFVYTCKYCKKFYGSDFEDEKHHICLTCENKLLKKRKEDKNE